jgi:hypothetical protein
VTHVALIVASAGNPSITMRTLVAALVVAVALVALAGSATAADTYGPYARIRQDLIGCSLDRTWHHWGAVERRRCKRLRRLYVLWSEPGESGGYHVHCRTSRCPATPIGEPDARAPIPSGAHVFH